MAKIYFLLYAISAAASLCFAGCIALKKRKNTAHDCRSCGNCALVEHGKDGKLIYTCAITRGSAPKFYYEHAIPVYCSWWKRRRSDWI